MTWMTRLQEVARDYVPSVPAGVAVTDRVSAALSRLVRRAMPELEQRVAGPRRARVTKASAAGGTVDEFHGQYSVTVQPILANGEDDPDHPEIPDLALPVIWGGANGRGVYARPAAGALVRIGYYEGDPSQPYVDAVLGEGFTVPASAVDELVIAQSDTVRLRIQSGGRIAIETTAGIDLLGASGGTLSELVRKCDTCAFTGVGHPAGTPNVKAR